ncbi:hypothetical protein GCM10009779_13700 [Polymorphospora rubra]|uniref:Uncharacterized protein n=1 Tax=Polymorphospora rubra TaxID=338584 RepID=A0A810MY73_9ACTN|nr:hypothetical protein Prubr_13390 [Polymorphospora rubra]
MGGDKCKIAEFECRSGVGQPGQCVAEYLHHVAGASVEVQVGEVAHTPALCGEPVVPLAVSSCPAPVEMAHAVVLGAHPALLPAEVEYVPEPPEPVDDR